MGMKKPVVFIDRDGTINVDGGYINHADNFILYPFAAQAIRMLNTHGYLAVVVTNQSGIAKGFYTEEVMHELHGEMKTRLARGGARVDAIYYCPHDPDAKIEQYRMVCRCRKPDTGMLEQAIAELPIDTTRMTMVGDKYGDIQTGFKMNCRTIMLNTGYGAGEYRLKSSGWARQPDYRAENLLEAIGIVLNK
ncbi:D-glycero-beta-D-manno-heptose 1,7-bisphosphate 7-phosphatase [Deferribacterales bacterium RsTz2092]|nr:D,D-heptose 1,7-bisphosphate phosphatase [Deferribacterales bacterium]